MPRISFLLGILVTLVPHNLVLADVIPITPSVLISAEDENTLETQVLAEINRARTDPNAYADYLEGIDTLTEEEKTETINFLRSQSPLNPINLSPQLSSVAGRILKNPSGTTTFENITSEGNTSEIIAMKLILENRDVIFRGDLENQGIACNIDSENLITCVIAYEPSAPSPVEETQPEPPLSGKIILEEQGTLAEGDEIMPSDSSLYDLYEIQGRQGQSLIINLDSRDFDTFVAIIDSENNIIDQNDDIDGNNTNSRLTITLPQNGVYYIIVNSYDPQGRGSYKLSVQESN